MTVLQATTVHDGEGEPVIELVIRIYPKEAEPLLILIDDATSAPRKERDLQLALPLLRALQTLGGP